MVKLKLFVVVGVLDKVLLVLRVRLGGMLLVVVKV